MGEPAPGRPARLSGWGRNTASTATLVPVDDPGRLATHVRSRPPRGLLARGAGRAYGDAAANAGGWVLEPLAPLAPAEADVAARTVTVSAGVTLGRLLDELLPQGLMLPVVPGTQHVTVGGAIAADIHGKNHHVDSSFGRWVQSLVLLDGTGTTRTLSAERDAGAFFATVGGMGLTGIVVSATLRLVAVSSDRIRATSTRVADFDDLLARLAVREAPTYQVAWVDCLATGRHRYRAVLDEGEHAGADELPAGQAAYAARARRPALPAPALPVSPLRPAVLRAFNTAWWHKAPDRREALVDLRRFFFPLDGVAGWNRLYGPRGFLQYQVVVPESQDALLRRVLDGIRAAGGTPSLVVLKRMGASTPGPLSFPAPGWTLAVDLPVVGGELPAALDRLDAEVAAAGGRAYLAKDSRMRPEMLPAMYPRLGAWCDARAALDPHGVFRSDLGRRLGLC